MYWAQRETVSANMSKKDETIKALKKKLKKLKSEIDKLKSAKSGKKSKTASKKKATGKKADKKADKKTTPAAAKPERMKVVTSEPARPVAINS